MEKGTLLNNEGRIIHFINGLGTFQFFNEKKSVLILT